MTLTVMKRILAALLCAAMFAALTAGCGSVQTDTAENETEAGGDDPVRIGVTFESFVIERWERDRDIFVSSAKDLGAVVNVQNATGDVEKQKEQIRYFIDKKMDVIVVIAVDCSALKEEVREAHEAGIPVIAYDRLILGSGVDLYISFDNVTVGRYMAQTIISSLPEGGKLIKINGPRKDYNVSLINAGFDREIADAENEYSVEDVYYASEWNGEEAFLYLSEHPDIADSADAVMCGNDSLAGQAVRYYAEKRRAGRIPIVGQDADLDACQRVVEGTQTMTVYKPIERLARRAAECAVALAGGASPESLISAAPRASGDAGSGMPTINDGTGPVAYVSIPPIMVDKDNIDREIIDSGFHMREDVYLNSR